MSHRAEDRWNSKFARFVTDYGPTRLAKQLEVHPSAVYHWVRGVTIPKPAHAAIIQRLAVEEGIALTFEEIYGHSRDCRAANPAIAGAIERQKARRIRDAELFLLRKRAVEKLFLRARKVNGAVVSEGAGA
jgi:hypothetical protein